MNKVKIFSTFHFDKSHYILRKELECEINEFAKEHEIISVSITCASYGSFSMEYTAAVVYKDKGDKND